MSNTKRITALLLLAALSLSGCGSQATQGEETIEVSKIAAEVMEIGHSSIQSEMVYAGKVNPRQTISVVSKMAGKVSEVYFDTGDKVEKDQVLFALDEDDIRDQIRQLEASVSAGQAGVQSAQNSLNSLTGGQYESSVLQLETGVENSKKTMETTEIALKNTEITLANARDAFANTETSYNNSKALYDAGALAKSSFDSAELGYKQAKAQVEQAELAYSQAQVSYDQAVLALNQSEESLVLATGKILDDSKRAAQIGVSQAQASVQSVQVQLDIARKTLTDTAVKAPISGYISTKTAKAGEYVSSALAAYTIVDIDSVKVEVKVSEALINKIHPGQEVELYIRTMSNEPITGKISTISPAADATSTFPVVIEIENPDGLIRPGMFAEVHFVSAFSEGTIVVARNTVMKDETNQYVFVNNNGTAEKVIVETGIDNGQEIEIISGISIGQQVVVKGQSYLEDGDLLLISE